MLLVSSTRENWLADPYETFRINNFQTEDRCPGFETRKTYDVRGCGW